MPACGPKPDDEFLFAGQPFGANNEIVKVLKGFGDALKRQGKNLEQAKDDIVRVLKKPSDAPAVAAEVAKRGAKVIKNAPKDICNGVAHVFGGHC